jgi:uncharacterized protein (TIGR02145 family)
MIKQNVWIVVLLPILLLGACSLDTKIKDPLDSEALGQLKGSVSGEVLDRSGNPVPGVTVFLSPSGLSSVTNPDGSYSISGVKGDIDYTVFFSRKGYLTEEQSGISLLVGESIKNINAQLQKSTAVIRGQVVLKNVDDAMLGKAPVLAGISVGIPNQNISSVTTSTGEFTLRDVVPEEDGQMVIAAGSGLGWGEQSISLKPDTTIEITVELNKIGGTIRGMVVSSDNDTGEPAPLAGMTITPFGEGLNVITDENGEFEISSIPTRNELTLQVNGREAISGLMVEEGAFLDGLIVDYSEEEDEEVVGLDIVVKNRTHVIFDTAQSVRLTASVVTGEEQVSAYLWNTSGDSVFDIVTAEAFLVLNDFGEEVKYAARGVNGETSNTGVIRLRKLSTKPEIALSPRTSSIALDSVLLVTANVELLIGGVKEYAWDVDGDGSFDSVSTQTSQVHISYSEPGAYSAVFRVTLNDKRAFYDTVSVLVAPLEREESSQSNGTSSETSSEVSSNTSSDETSSTSAEVSSETSSDESSSTSAEVSSETSSDDSSSSSEQATISPLVYNDTLDYSQVEHHGHIYQTIDIDTLRWFAQNLRTEKFRDSSQINVLQSATGWESSTVAAMGYYDFNEEYAEVYGALYNWYAIQAEIDGDGYLCPEGWRVANRADWTALRDYLGTATAGEMVKEAGTHHWATGGGSNASGLTVVGSGMLTSAGVSQNIKFEARFWAATILSTNGFIVTFSDASPALSLNLFSLDAISKPTGYAVRCVQTLQ